MSSQEASLPCECESPFSPFAIILDQIQKQLDVEYDVSIRHVLLLQWYRAVQNLNDGNNK